MFDDTDSLEECPYQRSHQVQRSRMAFHMMKCRKAMNIQMERCLFNAAHDVESYNMEKHLLECPDRTKMETWSTKVASDQVPVVTKCSEMVYPDAEEDWDEGNHQTYDPHAKNVLIPIYRQCTGESKATRKAFRREERARFQNLEEGRAPFEEVASPPEVVESPPSVTRETKLAFDYSHQIRQPKTKSMTFAVPDAHHLGFGRGRPIDLTPQLGHSPSVPPGFEAIKKEASAQGKKKSKKGKNVIQQRQFNDNVTAAEGDSAAKLLSALSAVRIENLGPMLGDGQQSVSNTGVATDSGVTDSYGDWKHGPSQETGGWTSANKWVSANEPQGPSYYSMPDPPLDIEKRGRGRGRLQQE